MLVSAHIQSAEFLDVAACIVHDLHFDVGELVLEGTTLVIPVYDDEPRDRPPRAWWSTRRTPRVPSRDRVWRKGGIRVNGVLSWYVHESEGISIYPINVLRYDAEFRRLVVVPSIPVDLWAEVSHLDVQVWLEDIAGAEAATAAVDG